MKFTSHNLFFVSDLHYMHKNITAGETVWDNPKENCRNFKTTKEMSQHMIDQINKYVPQDATLIDLGDWSFGGQQNIWNLRKQLNVKTIIHINGNHDNAIKKNIVLPNVKRNLPYSNDFINAEPIGGEYPDYVEAHCIFDSVHDYLEIIVDKKTVVLCHYPLEEWREDIHLHGHVHGKYHNKQKRNRIDVGIDSAYRYFGEYRPFTWDDILTIVKKQNGKI